MVAPLLRRLSALIVLAALCGSAIVPVFGDLHLAGDEACADDAWVSDAHAASHQTSIQFETVREPIAGDHCAACHLQRAMAGADDDAKRAQIQDTEGPAWMLGHTIDRRRSATVTSVPTRAPPVSLL